MPRVLAPELSGQHAKELLALEREELARLRTLYEEARLEIRGRLEDVGAETFTAQHFRSTLAQVEAGLRALSKKLVGRREAALQRELRLAVSQTLAEIAHFEPTFREAATGRIATSALRALAKPRALLLQRFERSIARYGSTVIDDVQRRLGVHLVKRSPFREVATDIAGRLPGHAIAGSRWRAERIVRTELFNALGQGQQAALEQAARTLPDLARQWDATLDARTSSICAALNGQVRGLHEAFNADGREIAHPPAHVNCRSRTVPWRAAWAEKEAR